jgi:hypothetical protein
MASSCAFPRRALNLVIDWYNIHQEELLENGRLANERKPLNTIEPLELVR